MKQWSFPPAAPPWNSRVSYMRKASVAMTPHVWKAWWKSASSGYFTAASMMIHHPVKNCISHKHEHARQVWTEIQQVAAASSNSHDDRGQHRHKTQSGHKKTQTAWAVPGLRQPQMRWRSFSPPIPRCTHSLHIGSRPEILTWLRGKSVSERS